MELHEILFVVHPDGKVRSVGIMLSPVRSSKEGISFLLILLFLSISRRDIWG